MSDSTEKYIVCFWCMGVYAADGTNANIPAHVSKYVTLQPCGACKQTIADEVMVREVDFVENLASQKNSWFYPHTVAVDEKTGKPMTYTSRWTTLPLDAIATMLGDNVTNQTLESVASTGYLDISAKGFATLMSMYETAIRQVLDDLEKLKLEIEPDEPDSQ